MDKLFCAGCATFEKATGFAIRPVPLRHLGTKKRARVVRALRVSVDREAAGSGQILNPLVDDVEQLLDVLLGNAGEGDAQVGLGCGDGADPVLVQEMHAQLFGFHGLQLQAHEVTGIERVVGPGGYVLAAVQDLLGLEGAPLHDLELLFLLGQELGRTERLDDQCLGGVGAVGYLGADDPHGLLLQGGHDRRVFIVVAVGKGDEPGAEAPDKLFLGGAVQLDGQYARVDVGELAEQRLLEAVLVEEPEIGVVRDGDHVAASLGHFLDGGHQGVTLGNSGGVAAGIVGEVQEHDGLALFLGRVLQFGLERCYVIAAGGGEGRMFLDDGAVAGTKGQVVVAPEHVRKDQVVTLVHEHVADDGEAVGQGVGDDGVAEVFPLLAGVFPQLLLAPQGAQFRFAGRRRIGVDVLGIKGGELVLDALQEHGAAVFSGDADGGVVFVGLVLGFGRLGQYPFGKEEVLSQVGQHFKDMRAVLGKQVVQFLCQWVHCFLLEHMWNRQLNRR